MGHSVGTSTISLWATLEFIIRYQQICLSKPSHNDQRIAIVRITEVQCQPYHALMVRKKLTAVYVVHDFWA